MLNRSKISSILLATKIYHILETEKKHIVIITGQHMTANPRVWKEANSLIQENYKVTILTTWYDESKLILDKQLLHKDVVYKPVVNLIKGEGGFNDRILSRVRRKLALLEKKIFKTDSGHLLVYNPKRQVKKALSESADLYIAHQETGLIVGCALLRAGKKVAFDIEDWYSRDYINSIRPIEMLQSAEQYAISKGAYISCPSNTMAKALMETYKSAVKPTVIYNSFSIFENNAIEQGEKKRNSLVWFSQVVGPGRGLETLVKALQFIHTPLEVHLIGNTVNGYRQQLEEEVSRFKHSIFFHEAVYHKQLLPLIAKYNIGLALENNYPDNKDTTISNKILQNLQAGNMVLASNTKGQAEIAELFPDSIRLVEVNNPQQWADIIERLLNKPIEKDKQEQMNIFKEKISWETQEKKLLALVKSVIGPY